MNLVAKIMREPLLQFLLLGGLIFAVDIFTSVNKEDPQLIVVDANRLEKLIKIFREGQGRLPKEDEVDNLIVKWTQNEIFYREAVALNLDEGDDMVRSRLILKMRNILFNRIIQQIPSDEQLLAWFELNREKYDTPSRYSFEQFPIRDASNLKEAQLLAKQVNQKDVPKAYRDITRQYPRRPVTNLESLFGLEHTAALLQEKQNHWVPVRSRSSWHLARVYAVSPAIPADFAKVKSKVLREYKKAASGLQVSEMADAISDKYKVYLEFDNNEVNTVLASVAESARHVKPVTADARTLKARAGVAEDQSIQ
ncbi:MAG: peptidyl-prolyl cis-trans isomerase [Cellvibrionaceae bacterium]|nr:peptidyl-prolyl cis-trans isomerase [Cellvibrionaceae bacterium]